VEFRIGTGGWQYFPIVTADKLKAYSRLFDFVEVNSTYYSHVPLGTVARWREVVPPGFEFSVKCSREVNEALRRGDRERLDHLIDYMTGVCDTLDSMILVLQTPSTFDPGEVSESLLGRLVDRTREASVRLAWEMRHMDAPSAPSLLRSVGIIQVTDLSRSSPLAGDDVLYTRLFGLGKHNMYHFAAEDLDRVEERAASSGSKKAYFAFHSVAMYADALKFKQHIGAKQAQT